MSCTLLAAAFAAALHAPAGNASSGFALPASGATARTLRDGPEPVSQARPPTTDEPRLLEVERRDHPLPVTAVCFLDGNGLVTGCEDGVVRCWSPCDARSPRRSLALHEAGVVSVDVSPTGEELLSAGLDGVVRLWSLSRNEELAEWAPAPVPLYPCPAVFAPDGRWIAWGSRSMVFVQSRTDDQPRLEIDTQEHNVTSLAFSPDGGTLVSADGYGNVRLWDVESGDPVGRGGATSRPPDPRPGSREETLREAGAAKVLASSVLFSPDGMLLAAWGFDSKVSVLDAAGSRVVRSFEGVGPSITAACFGARQQWFAVASREGGIRLLDPSNSRPLPGLAVDPGSVVALTSSSDGSRLAAATGKDAVVWRVERGNPRR